MNNSVEALNAIKTLPLVLPIVEYPNDTLLQPSKPVLSAISSDKTLQELMDAMVDTIEAHNALGLSAVQVGAPLRVFVAKTPYGVIKVINPAITKFEGELLFEREGCLSVPGIYPKVLRSQKVTMEYLDENGDSQTYEAEDYWARIIQHEFEHLTGKTFFNSMNAFARASALKNFKHYKRKVK